MLVSIITPTYNNGELLKRLYNSIKDQSYQNLKWIIIDDGSIDQTKEIVESFKDNKIVYVKTINKGPNSARNTGERNIPKNSKFVVFIDSDDTFFDCYTLEKMVYKINATPKEIGAVAFTSIDSITGKNVCHLKEKEVIINYIDSLKGDKFSGEFISIQKIEILSLSKWPENVFGFELIRHWEINKKVKYLLTEEPGRIYFRNRIDNLTSPETTLKRSKNMAFAINIILDKHGNVMKKEARNRYGYFLFTQGVYYTLSGLSLNSFKPLLKSMIIQQSIKYKFLSFCLLFFTLLPLSMKKKIYLFIRRKNYNYAI